MWAATEARALPHGGISVIAEATGMSRGTIYAGIRELEAGEENVVAGGRSRKVRSEVRKRLTDQQPGIRKALEELVEPTPAGIRDAMSPLRWMCKQALS